MKTQRICSFPLRALSLFAGLIVVSQALASDPPRKAESTSCKGDCCATEPLPAVKIKVTGSHIPQKVVRRGPVLMTVSPVYVIDRVQIEQSGAVTTRQALKSLPFFK